MTTLTIAGDPNSFYQLQDPAETATYPIDWNTKLDSLGSPSETISASSWRIEPSSVGSPSGEESVTAQLVGGDNITSCKLSGLDPQVGVYRLINTVMTTQGHIWEQAITIRCQNR